MNAVITSNLPYDELAVVWQWFQDLPVYIKRQLRIDAPTQEIFQAKFDDDLNVLVYDDGLLGFVNCEPKGDGIFEVHLFCPRRTLSEKLAEAIATFFVKVRETNEIKTLLFNARCRQIRLRECLFNEGCIYTGWSFRERGEDFDCLIYQKSVINT